MYYTVQRSHLTAERAYRQILKLRRPGVGRAQMYVAGRRLTAEETSQ